MDKDVSTGLEGSNNADNGNSQGSRNSSTESTASTEGRREDNNSRSTAGQPTEKSAQIPLVVNVEVPTEKPKKKRGRPPKDPNAAPTPSQPKQAKAKGGAAALNPLDKESISQIILTFSAITASRPNMEVWALTEKEADQLAEPLANMLARSEALNKVSGTNADAVALVLAAFMIFVPKFLMWQQTRPKKPKTGDKVKYGTNKRDSRNGSTASNQTGTSDTTNGSSIGQPSGNDRQPDRQRNDKTVQFGGALADIVAPLGGI